MVSMASILEADELFLSKITSRQSCETITHSSRIYYRNSNDKGVPFKWEMKPGKAICQPEDELILPICPPPGATPLLPMRVSLERTRTKPCMLLKLWRKILIKSKQEKADDHRMDSKIVISSSGSGSSSSFSSNVRSDSSRVQSPEREFSDDGAIITCAPWSYNTVMFCFARRN